MDKKNLRNRKGKKRLEKGLSLFEILILIISVGTFSYLIGNELGFVSAGNPNANTMPAENNPITATVAETAGAAPGPTGGGVASDIASGLYPDLGNVPIATVPTGVAGTTAQSSLAQTVSSASAGVPTAPATSGAAGTPTAVVNQGFLDKLIGSWQMILLNAAIAASLYFVTTFLGKYICPTCTPEAIHAFGLALSLGYGLGSGIEIVLNAALGTNILQLGFLGLGGGLIGMGIGIILFLIFYRDVKISQVLFTCYPWQPQTGGTDCDKCNKGEFPCTQYKCQSLGQSCELLNPGTSNELCTWVNRNDIAAPVISSWDGPLDKTQFEYVPDTATLPPDKGVVIKDKLSSDGCIPPFTQLYYGISLDKPGMCRIDVNRTSSFDTMAIPISYGRYLYNHTLLSDHAGANESAAEGISLPNGGKYEIFVRCKSRNGYANTGTFVFKYCVQSTPDITAPTIELTNPINGMPVQVGTTSQYTEIYTNKPADCRWSQNDEDYDTMAGTMTCSQSITEMNAYMLYKCSTTLTGLKDNTENDFYFRCKSYPTKNDVDRVKNEESYNYTLIGTRALVIDNVTANGLSDGATIKDSTNTVKVTILATTSAGYNDGVAKCSLKQTSESDKSYVPFLNTNSYKSTQDLGLSAGSYSYSIKCCDLGGNCVTQPIDFNVETDVQSPIIVRAYNEGNNLKVVTDESSQCVYDTTSCSYNFDDGLKMTSSDGINHYTVWNTDNTLYIKCQDQFGNQPAPDECSMVIRPFDSQ